MDDDAPVGLCGVGQSIKWRDIYQLLKKKQTHSHGRETERERKRKKIIDVRLFNPFTLTRLEISPKSGESYVQV